MGVKEGIIKYELEFSPAAPIGCRAFVISGTQTGAEAACVLLSTLVKAIVPAEGA